VMLIFIVFCGIYFFVNPDKTFVENAYLILVFISLVVCSFLGFSVFSFNLTSWLGVILLGISFVVIVKKLVIWKIGKNMKDNQIYFVYPLISFIGGIVFLVMSLFVDIFSRAIISLLRTLGFASDPTGTIGVLGLTIAENKVAGFVDIFANLSVNNSVAVFGWLELIRPMFFVFNLSTFMVIGFFILLFYLYKNSKFLKNEDNNKQFFLILFGLIWIVGAIIGSFASIRMIFFVGAPAALIGAFAIYFIFSKFLSIRKKYINLDGIKINWVLILVIIFIPFMLFLNVTSMYAMSNSMSISLNPNWQDAMSWVHDNTPNQTVLMSWWDYGYWFQSAGKRFSMADGGNMNGTRNWELANFFTSGNFTEWRPYLNSHGVDYIVVDYSLIGKYGAMSLVGSLGEKNDGFINLGRPVKEIPKEDGSNVYVYSSSGLIFYIPIDVNGQLSGDIKVTYGAQTLNLKYLCTEQGLVTLTDEEPSFESCLVFSNLGIFLPYPNMDAALSNFAQLYLFDGKGVPFVEKVYDNMEIKIFEIDKSENRLYNPYPNYLYKNDFGVNSNPLKD
jgi:asparagine N-glycosylation enzyme membrane subunit Stt3